MSLWRHLTRGVRSLLNRSAVDRDIADEVEHYLDEAAASLQSTGLSPEEARRAVRLEYGHASRIQERVRAYGWENVVDAVGADLRYGLRQLYRRPAFALAAVLTLALGIGATTAIFSVVYSVLIKPLPYPNADELVRIRHRSVNDDDLWASSTMYLTYRDANRTFVSIGLWDESSATLTDRGEPERVRALRVTDGILQALGVQPVRGRWFTKQEYGPAADRPEPVILSYGFWQRRFGGDDAALGSELSMEAPGGSRGVQSVANIASGQTIDVGIVGGRARRDAAPHWDSRRDPIRVVDTSRPPARDPCPASPIGRPRTSESALSPV